MKKPYRFRWDAKIFVRAVIFGIAFLVILLTLNYFNSDKVKGYDMLFWNSFWTLGMTYCAYVVIQIVSGTPHYKEVMFATSVLCVSAVTSILTKEQE